ncbi:MAG: PDZ domain-containing protein [Candidatus Hydrogenedentota bacterium]
MNTTKFFRAWRLMCTGILLTVLAAPAAITQDAPENLRATVDRAVQKVKPSLVRIHVVETHYSDGREQKYEASGSGVVITEEGHVVTNHHVAGHAKQLKVIFADKREFEASLIGTDPLTDIAVIKITPPEPHTFPVVTFGDSDLVQVGDHVLAMGSPLALSQSVTLGIASNTEMIMPDWISRWGGIEQDGENVGALVRWIGHDAAIYGGNSGGPLVNLQGEIIGINEISMGLGGAIPGNLAQSVAQALITQGKVVRAWIGLDAQPRLKTSEKRRGVLVSGVIKGSPAKQAGIKPGDIILSVGGAAVDVQFMEQLPDFNRMMSELPLGEPVPILLQRGEEALALTVTPSEREPMEPQEVELRPWGITVRDISFMLAKELKRESTDGVLVTSVRAGGGAGDAKPAIRGRDIIVQVNGAKVRNVAQLREATEEILADNEETVPVLTTYERKTEEFVTVVEVGSKELEDPGLEVKKAWLPLETQVLTRDVAERMGKPDLTGFRITHVYTGSNAEKAGLEVGDIILAVDDEKMTASAPEHYEELQQWIRQYRVNSTVELDLLREGAQETVAVDLAAAPKRAREMPKYRENNFEFTVRNVTFHDRAEERWPEDMPGVLVEEVKSGGWAALGQLSSGDLILAVDDKRVTDVGEMQAVMDRIAEEKPDAVVFQVMRKIYTRYIELEPKWENIVQTGDAEKTGDRAQQEKEAP